MVHAVVVVAVDEGSSAAAPLLWQGYTPEWNLPRDAAPRRVAALCAQVFADVRLRLACDDSFFVSGRVGPPPSSSSSSSSQHHHHPQQQSSGGGGPLPRISVAEGVLRLSGDSCSCSCGSVRVVWRVIPQFAAAACVALQAGEALCVAQHALAVLCRAFLEQTSAGAAALLQSQSQQTKPPLLLRKELFETRPDEAAALLEHLLPCGMPLVLGPGFAKHLRKEAEALMGSK